MAIRVGAPNRVSDAREIKLREEIEKLKRHNESLQHAYESVILIHADNAKHWEKKLNAEKRRCTQWMEREMQLERVILGLCDELLRIVHCNDPDGGAPNRRENYPSLEDLIQDKQDFRVYSEWLNGECWKPTVPEEDVS